MKKIILTILAVVTIVAVQAQEKEFPDGRHYGMNKRLMKQKMLGEKLKLSEEQRQKAKTLNEDYRRNLMDLRNNEDITVREWKKRMSDLNTKHREDMQDLLSKEQKMQLEKMKDDRRKMADIDANARLEKMKLRLDLNNDQVEKLRKQRSEMLEKMKSIHEDKSMDMMKKREEMKMLMEKRKESMKSVLTEEQMKKMQEFRKQMPRKRKVLS